VQSVALRLIVERQRAIDAFKPKEYWTVDARLAPNGDEQAFPARLFQIDDQKLAASPDKKGQVLKEREAREHAGNLERSAFLVAEVRRKETKRRPSPPFTTSTLQQEAGRKLGFSARKTMRVAQQLYEGVSLPREGQTGLITYMRTDSTSLAEQAMKEIRAVVKQQYGDRYALPRGRHYKTKTRGAQEAHEAVRPTKAARLPDDVAPHLTADQARLYRLVWQRAVASQMAEAVLDQVSVDIEATADGAPRYLLRATGQTVKFDGFRRVYWESADDAPDQDAESRLPELTEEQVLRLLEILPEQHYTQPPPRFTEASLVKELERLGIGRPSTYAPTISNLLDRDYIHIEERRLTPEDVAFVVIDLLVEHFSEIVDYSFTARMEEELDDIAEGKMRWVQVLDEFYGPFERLLEKKEDEIERPKEELNEDCPKCIEEGRKPPGQLVIKLGRAGRFVACDKWPECDYSRDLSGRQRPEPEELDEKCPECGKNLLKRVGRYGPFIGCSGYPDCRYIKREEQKTGVQCPKCREEGREPPGDLIVKRARRRRGSVFYGCNRYPECDFTVGQKPLPEPCPNCGGLLVEGPKGVKCSTNGDYEAGEGKRPEGAGVGGGPTEAA
jgi:DNA topoisomerase-1